MLKIGSGASTKMRTLHTWPHLIPIMAGIGSCICHYHHGRYRFLHMPFSLKMSQDVFQMWMDQATDHSLGIITIHDNICMFICTPEEHDEHLLCLMESVKTHGIVFNSTKCHIRQPQIAFYGTVFTGQSMWPDPSKIQPLQDLPAPDLQTKLHPF